MKYMVCLAFWVFILSLPQVASAERLEDILSTEVVVHFVDVGVGDAILIELPKREHEVLIDGGDRRKGFNFLEYVGPYLDDPVELAVITHPDYDHWSGIGRLQGPSAFCYHAATRTPRTGSIQEHHRLVQILGFLCG